ncbi:YcxB family protein [Flavobacterium notoginsengisoli]|uniref:YcxB family protein n=1 Tax=Flavobacterium notoginsengisoli TaxID=1478199 RepID=UPI0036356276
MENIRLTFHNKVALDLLLYHASKSESLNKSRTKSRLVFISIIALLSALFIQLSPLISVCFIILGSIVFIFFPKYLAYYYKKHFSKLIKTETFKNRLGQTFEICFTDAFIEIKNPKVETKYNISNFEYVAETAEYFFIKLKVGDFLIYPKAQITNVETLKEYFKKVCIDYNIDYKNELNWKWK